ncbi:hypothetical protein [Spirosoma koreense]
MPSLLILCSDADSTALQLAQRLARRAEAPIDLVTASQLAAAPVWRIHLGQQATAWRIRLADGRCLSSDTVGAIYCRLDYTLAPFFTDQTDATYAAMEFQAMVSGWLRSAGVPVVNAVAPVMLCAVPANPWLRQLMMARAGLPVAQIAALTAPQRWRGLSRIAIDARLLMKPVRTGVRLQEPLSDASTSVLIAGDTLKGALADQYSTQLRQLQADVKAAVMQVAFSKDQQGNYRAVDFQTIPVLTTAEEVELVAGFLADFVNQANLIHHDSYSRYCV